jgi:hypothetical protein
VKANNEKEALEFAFAQREEIVREDMRRHRDGFEVMATIRSEKDLPEGWNLLCLPWGQKTPSNYWMVEDLES